MILKLYKTISEKNKVTKELTDELTLDQVTLLNPCSVLDPVFVLEMDGSFPQGYNYLYAPDFGRYYFIKDKVCIRGAFGANYIYQVPCHVDVLMTYDRGIRMQDVILARQESQYNALLIDRMIPTQSNATISRISFDGTTFNPSVPAYILMTAGSGSAGA